jgi:membrane-associated phospholipid phosphatase
LRATTRLLIGILSAAIPLYVAPDARAQVATQVATTDDTPADQQELTQGGETNTSPASVEPESSDPGSTPKSPWLGHATDFVQDQKQIWTSPARLRFIDATWLIPVAGITAGLFATDRQYSASLPMNSSTISHYKNLSNAGLASLAGAGAGMYLMSFPTHNEHWRETGFLAGEAAIDSLIPAEIMKYSLGRERPYEGNGSGAFFRGGTSFPSEHATAAWAIAGVFAHEYSGPLAKFLAYGLASAVSFSRVRAGQHFPSDAFVGSALGYLIAQNVYSQHHDPELGGSSWSSAREFMEDLSPHSPEHMGSPNVPLDSWIYPALERLAALGYIPTEILGLRPWTRLECARQVMEAGEHHADTDAPREATELYDALAGEFAQEIQLTSGEGNLQAQVESVYARSMVVSGSPLTDNQHFGETVLNDYGRPFQEGFNSVVGSSAWTAAGPFVAYARGEYQSSPSAPSLSPATLDFISAADGLPPNPPAMPVAAISRFRLLDAYVGMTVANWQVSFGRQSLWWGPGDEGAMILTNNAEPLNKMFRISRVSPFRLPWVLGLFGDIRMEAFIGQVAGQEFINNSVVGGTSGLQGQYGKDLDPQPFLSGGKISFKFTPNLEISASKTTLYGGPGNPLTLRTLYKSTFSIHSNGYQLGDGRAGLDFSYRLPKLRNWLSVYGDAFQEDEISPVNRPYKAAFQSGLYLAKVPRMAKLDFRLEGGTTSPLNFPTCNGCYYSNGQYVNGYTNNGELMGTWIGRAAQGEAIRSNFWLSARKKIGIELRHRKIDQEYLAQGGTQNDVAVNADFLMKSGFRVSGMLQYESWQIPLLAAGPQRNVVSSIQFSYWPRGWAK